jgi:peptidoglycan/LPS O-acetylase OafA/YrhL
MGVESPICVVRLQSKVTQTKRSEGLLESTFFQSRGRLAKFAEGRDNNFNLMRVVAAALVILTHAFGFTGNGQFEPLKTTFGVSFGTWSVDVFFVASGFLIAKSWDTNQSIARFLWARFTRIYPALWACVAVCVFAIGWSFTTLSTRDYLQHTETLKFVVANSTLLPFGVFPSLPGTFAHQGGNINVSLWTLPYELKMYLALLVLGKFRLLYVRGVVVAVILVAFTLHAWTFANGNSETPLASYSRFAFVFFSGTFFYLNRERIVLHPVAVMIALTCLGASLLMENVAFRALVLSLVTPYLVMYCAYVPAGPIRAYNRLGDYSYGLYIYGMPIQQTVLALAGGKMSVAANFSISLAFAIIAAVISWHVIEKRALRFGLQWFPRPTTKPISVDSPRLG